MSNDEPKIPLASLDPLLGAWDRLNSATRKIQCAQVHEMTRVAADLEAERKAMELEVMRLSRGTNLSESGRSVGPATPQ